MQLFSNFIENVITTHAHEMINYNKENLVVIEFTKQRMSIIKDSKVQGFNP